MLLLAVTLSLTPPQVLAGPAFEDLARRTEALCPTRRLRAITPADLDLAQETFIDRLAEAERERIAAANDAERRCAGRDGLACPTTVTLEAMEKLRLMDRFAAYLCKSGG